MAPRLSRHAAGSRANPHPNPNQVLTRIELQEIKQRVTAMLSEFEATEAAEAVEALSGSTADLMPGEKVEADEHLQEGAHFEVTRTLMAATKRRLGTVLGEVSDTAERQLTALGRLDAWLHKASDGSDDWDELLKPKPDEPDGSEYLASLPDALERRGHKLAKAHAALSRRWEERARRLAEEAAEMRRLSEIALEEAQENARLALEAAQGSQDKGDADLALQLRESHEKAARMEIEPYPYPDPDPYPYP